MKRLLLFFCILLFQISFGQSDTSIHYFKRLGWTVKYPVGFHYVVDATSNDSTTNDFITDPDSSGKMNHHFNIIAKGFDAFAFSYFNYKDHPITRKNLDSANYNSSRFFVKALSGGVVMTDSSESNGMIDGVPVYKYSISGITEDKTPIHYVLYSGLTKGYFFVFICLFNELTEGSEMETMIQNSKFDK
jgi:hypothetical protein